MNLFIDKCLLRNKISRLGHVILITFTPP